MLADAVHRLSRLASRWADFEEACADLDSPLASAGFEPVSGGGVSDPTPRQAAGPKPGRAIERRAAKEVAKVARFVDYLETTVNDVCPRIDRTKDVWCRNKGHGHSKEPRARNGSQWCEWCRTFEREYGVLPDAYLLDARARGARISRRQVEMRLSLDGPRQTERKVV